MGKIIIITFAFLAFAFYEMSGGSEFVPRADEKRAALAVQAAEEDRLLAEAKAERLTTQPAQPAPVEDVTASVVLASAVVAVEETNADVALVVDEVKAQEVTADIVTAAVIEPEAPADIREVTAARVNMRDGPGQNFGVIAKLTNGEQVEILQDPGDGWVKLRVSDSGREGWMADFLLTASNN